jgi:hypothetical protein
MKDFDVDKTWFGATLGLLAPFATLVLYYLIKYHYMTIRGFIDYMVLGDTYTAVVTLCVLVNLGVFYLFLWKNKYLGARGVLLATFIWGAVIMYLKFFTTHSQ